MPPSDENLRAVDDESAILDALLAAGDVVYIWDVETGAMDWSRNAADVLGLSVETLKSAAAYAALLDPSERANRNLRAAEVADVRCPVIAEYRLTQEDRAAIWVEERLLWSGRGAKGGAVIGVLRDVTERKEREARLSYLAFSDELTGHLNRARLRERLAHSLAYAFRYNVPAGYLVVGIDNMVGVNQAYGFDITDEVIVAIGGRLAGALGDRDAIGRVAGGKFGIVLNDCTPDHLDATAHRLVSLVRDEVFETRVGAVSCTVSIGAAALPGAARTSHDAMSFAEEALHQAKSNGRDSVALYQPSLQLQSIRRRNIEVADEIFSALKEDRVQLAFQPIVDAETCEPTCYESLARIVRADGRILPAADFIPVAEQLGLIRLIDTRVTEGAVRALEEHPDTKLTVNVSGLTATDKSWLTAFLGLIHDARSVAERLTVEITETVAIRDLEESIRFVSTLKDLGCRVAIDDFGAGYTSFQNLKSVPVDMVKIDGVYVKNVDTSADNQLFVRTLLQLASNFGIETVAEMVGRQEEALFLRKIGIRYFQGFFYGRPRMTLGKAGGMRASA